MLVFVNGQQILNSDWVDEGGGQIGGTTSGDYVVDTTFSGGFVGVRGEDVDFDNMMVRHNGMMIRDTDLFLGPGATITVAVGGTFDAKNGTANSTRAALIDAGGTITEEDFEWLDAIFDETIVGFVTINCADIEIDRDIEILPGGQLTVIGSILRHAEAGKKFRILTDNSTVDPPIVVKSSRFYDVITRIRTLNPVGETYELNEEFEFILDGPEPQHPFDFISQPIWGRQSNKNTGRGHGDLETTIRFFSHDDMCLFGKMQKWMDDEVLLEIIYPRGVMHKCKLIDLFPGRSSNANIRLVEFVATFREFS
jgi:hypothetical protein